MGGKASRDKGNRSEREVVAILELVAAIQAAGGEVIVKVADGLDPPAVDIVREDNPANLPGRYRLTLRPKSAPSIAKAAALADEVRRTFPKSEINVSIRFGIPGVDDYDLIRSPGLDKPAGAAGRSVAGAGWPTGSAMAQGPGDCGGWPEKGDPKIDSVDVGKPGSDQSTVNVDAPRGPSIG